MATQTSLRLPMSCNFSFFYGDTTTEVVQTGPKDITEFSTLEWGGSTGGLSCKPSHTPHCQAHRCLEVQTWRWDEKVSQENGWKEKPLSHSQKSLRPKCSLGVDIKAFPCTPQMIECEGSKDIKKKIQFPSAPPLSIGNWHVTAIVWQSWDFPAFEG